MARLLLFGRRPWHDHTIFRYSHDKQFMKYPRPCGSEYETSFMVVMFDHGCQLGGLADSKIIPRLQNLLLTACKLGISYETLGKN